MRARESAHLFADVFEILVEIIVHLVQVRFQASNITLDLQAEHLRSINK